MSNEAIQFGTFELDRCSGELRKHGVKIRLQEQPFQVLLLLLDHPGSVTSREEIRQRLWPENTFVDFDNAISSAVRKLREALGDHSENPRFIETVAKRGYRFIAPVATNGLLSEAQVLPIAPPVLPVRTRRWTGRAWFGALALTLASAGAVSLLMTWRTAKSEPDFVATPLTSYPGSERSPSFSPDGSRVAFSWDHVDGQSAGIYVKMLDSGNPVRLTDGSHFDYSPAWSPDGKKIAFRRYYWPDIQAVMSMSALGGQERELFRGKDRLGSFGSDQIPVHPFLAWSADNRYLFMAGPNSANPDGFAIFRLAETGEQKQVTFPSPGPGGDGGATVSADGKHLAFVRTTSRATLDLYTVLLGTDSLPIGPPRRILSDVWIEGLAWTADSREIVFAGTVHDKEGFWRIGVDGERTAQAIAGLGLNAAPSKLKSSYFDRGTDVAISPQGQYLVYSQTNSDMNIWRVGLRGREKGKAAPLIHSTRDESYQAYSADGRKIVFESDRSGTEEIWVANADGSDATQLTFNSGWSGSPNFSPDGRSIAFDRQEVLTWAIYVMTVEGDHPVRVAANAADDFRPSWSSDGRWIFFTSARTGRFEIWKVRAAGGKALQVTKTGGGFQKEAPEGGAIYYLKDAGAVNSLWKCAEDGTQDQKVLDSVSEYSPAKSGIYFLPGKWSPALPLRFFDFATRRTTTLFFLDGTRVELRMSVSPDERWLLFEQQDGTLGDLMLVKNFR